MLFLVAGLCEIGGGYLVWLWLRNGRGVWLGALGGLILFLYGVLPTLQPAQGGAAGPRPGVRGGENGGGAHRGLAPAWRTAHGHG